MQSQRVVARRCGAAAQHAALRHAARTAARRMYGAKARRHAEEAAVSRADRLAAHALLGLDYVGTAVFALSGAVAAGTAARMDLLVSKKL